MLDRTGHGKGRAGRVSERRAAAQQRVSRTLERVLLSVSPEEAEAFAARIETAAEGDARGHARRALVQTLSGREYTPWERTGLESEMLLRSFDRRRELLSGALTASQVADLLGTTRQTPYDRLKRGTLLAVYDRGAWRFPAWQFDPDGPDGVVPGLREVLRDLRVDPLAKVSWLTIPNPVLEAAPIEVLRRGETQRVIELARDVNVL